MVLGYTVALHAHSPLSIKIEEVHRGIFIKLWTPPTSRRRGLCAPAVKYPLASASAYHRAAPSGASFIPDSNPCQTVLHYAKR